MKKEKGFTLIELVVVMAIIAILSVIIVGAILAARTAATNAQRTGAVRTIETALEARAARCQGSYFVQVPAVGVAPCTTIDTTSVTSVITALKGTTPKFLTTDVFLDNTFQYTISAPSGTNGYVLKALDGKGDTPGTGVLYTAER